MLTRSLQGSIAVTLPFPSCTFPGRSRGKHPSPENIPCPGLGTGLPRGWKMMDEGVLPQRAEKVGAEMLGAEHWVLEGRRAGSFLKIG